MATSTVQTNPDIQANKAALRNDVRELFELFEKSIFEDPNKLEDLFKSGAIDFSEPQTNYVLAKQIMQALGQELTRQFSPPGSLDTRTHRKEVKNLYVHL